MFRREMSLYAGRVVALMMDDLQSVDIDTPEEFAAAPALMNIQIEPHSVLAPPSKENDNTNS
jgi:CMP-N-acetylneuraminic acid synthetase